MNIKLLLELEQTKQTMEYIIQIKNINNKKQQLRRLNNKLKQTLKKIKSECIKDGHYYDFSFPTDEKYEIKKCKICGHIQKNTFRKRIDSKKLVKTSK